jgi:hypothetical protein
MDEFDKMGDIPVIVVEPEKPEPKKAKKVEVKSDMQTLADRMKEKLTSGFISLDRSVFPHVEFSSGDFGDCDLSFSDAKQTEVKIRCYVEKGFESVSRLRNLATQVQNALKGKCTVSGYSVDIQNSKGYTYSGAGKRVSTLVWRVTIHRIN